jgi:hypothetical protein
MADPEVERLSQAAKVLHENRTGLVLTGRIKDGKLVLDQATQDEIARKFAKADTAFVALNSPFDPESQSV